MRLGALFVATLAVSVIVSSCAAWGLTYSTSYGELRDMSSGFSRLATDAVLDFEQLVQRLLSSSNALVSGILDTEYERSVLQLNATGLEFLAATIDLMGRTKNATAQAQGLVTSLVAYFGSFMQSVITDFEAVATGYASRLRLESAARTQDAFRRMLQDRIRAIQMQVRLYELGSLNFSRLPTQPLDDGSCSLMATLCAVSAELGVGVYVDTASGNSVLCDVTDTAYQLSVQRLPGGDRYQYMQWPPFQGSLGPPAGIANNLTAWKQACLAGSNQTFMDVVCPRGQGMQYPDYCNATCGFDPRCRPWFSNNDPNEVPQTRMSQAYDDIYKGEPCITLSFSVFSDSPRSLVAVAATDFYFSDVDAYLATMPSMGVSQTVVVILNSTELLILGNSRACIDPTVASSGVPIAQTCSAALQELGVWLAANRDIATNVSLDLKGTLWDVFPSVLENFAVFVAVAMNKSEVYSVITATNQAAHDTLQNISHQQSVRMAALEAAALAEMDAVASETVAALQAEQLALTQHSQAVHSQTAQTFNASRKQSEDDIHSLTATEFNAISQLEDYHIAQVVKSIGVTFGAVVGIFVGILLAGAYGTWSVTKQVQRIAEVMEDVAHMRVEELQVSQDSSVGEVRRIEAALNVLARRLAEYKSYMPAGLFQQVTLPAPRCPTSAIRAILRKENAVVPRAGVFPFHSMPSIVSEVPSAAVHLSPVLPTQLMRRCVAVLAANLVGFQNEAAQRSPEVLEGLLSRFVSVVHCAATKLHGNVDVVVGDQLLVTFNAHFNCSDPPIAASSVALDVLTTLKTDNLLYPHIQMGLAAGPVFTGHVGYGPFKSMLAAGPPMKVASMLAHLSGFEEPVAVVCPSVEERIKYRFRLQPADLVALPTLGEHVTLYSKSVTVFVLEAQTPAVRGPQDWLCDAAVTQSPGFWTAIFNEVVKARSTDRARDTLQCYLNRHPHDLLAHRLLARVTHWQPQAGILLAERPDTPQCQMLPLTLSAPFIPYDGPPPPEFERR